MKNMLAASNKVRMTFSEYDALIDKYESADISKRKSILGLTIDDVDRMYDEPAKYVPFVIYLSVMYPKYKAENIDFSNATREEPLTCDEGIREFNEFLKEHLELVDEED